jgi:1-acyl-sn-glycerol-3-phosphate acyltransferase
MTEVSLASRVVYNLSKYLAVNPLLLGVFRLKTYGLEHIPKDTPVILVANHASNFDVPVLTNAVDRPVAYMAKEELFTSWSSPILRTYGAFPVKRGTGDRGAIKASLQALAQGWTVGIFLEGTRTEDGKVRNPRLGAALIAAKAQVPVIPVSIWGTDNTLGKGEILPKPAPLTVRISELLDPPESTDKAVLQRHTEKYAQIINQLHDLGR